MSKALKAHLVSRSQADTEALARSLARRASAPGTLLLSGPIGAGKSHFARAFIRAAGYISGDIPSPTFTLVQTYETDLGEIWHSDLYRLNSVDEVDELGLLAAFDEAICLVEWPDRLGDERPADALELTFTSIGTTEERGITISTTDPKWAPLLADLERAPG